MAKLDPNPYPGFEDYQGGDSMTYIRQEQAKLEAIVKKSRNLPEGEVVGALLSWPRGDGKALYVVTKAKPLTLQHVPYGDAWTVEPALIRGLTVADVRQMVQRERGMAKLFGRS